MKTLLKKISMIGGLALFICASCKKSDSVIKSNGGDAGTLTASTTTPVLDKSKVNDSTSIITFKFSPAKYNFSAASTATLQIDLDGDNFKTPASVAFATGVTSQGYSTTDFNAILLKQLHVTGGTTVKLNARIQYLVGVNTIVYSNVTQLTATPFNLASYVYAVGAFQGWNISNQDSLLSATGNNVYVGAFYFPAGANNNQFLITPVKGSYNNKYATTEPITQTTTTITVNANNNLCAPSTPGEYMVTLDLNKNTISFQAIHAYSMIGSATAGGWGADTQLSLVNDGSNNMWVAHNLPLVVGEYKFREDNAWSVSWGPSATAGTIVTSGAVGDGNIQLTAAGNYNVVFYMPVLPIDQGSLGTTTFTITKQ